MRVLVIAAAVIILVLIYAVWPVLGIYQFASAVDAKDAAAVGRLVDFRALKKSLTKQILRTYIEASGKDKKLGKLGTGLALGVGRSIVEPIVNELVNQDTLLALLSRGKVAAEGSSVSLPHAPFAPGSTGNGFRLWWAMDYGIGDVYVHLPPGKPRDQQIQVKFSLTGWHWKLSALDLPDALLMQLANEIIKKHEANE